MNLEIFSKELISSYSIDSSNISIHSNTLIIKKFNWDFQESLQCQKECHQFVRENKKLKIFIICNHPHCFTLGRGLQRGKNIPNLESFDESNTSKLSFACHKIKRAGGLTFHYPGQIVVYPIVSLGEHTFSLKELISSLFSSVKFFCLEDSGTILEENNGHLVGLWHKSKKVASLGIAISHFTTYHGMAFNLKNDEAMFNELRKLNPCGLSGSTYTSYEKLSNSKLNLEQVSDFILAQLVDS